MWIQHNPHLTSHGPGGQIFSEGADHLPIVAMSPSAFAPDDSVFGVGLFVMGLVNIAGFLSEIPLRRFSILHSLDVHQRLRMLLRSVIPSVAGEDALDPKSDGCTVSSFSHLCIS